MKLIELSITALIPTRAGCAVFLGAGDKVIHFFIELQIGQAINEHLSGEVYERPMTYDMVSAMMKGHGSSLTKVIIEDCQDGVFFAKQYWQVDNELGHRKVVVVDSRPSDAMALSVRQDAPLYIVEEIWDAQEDMTTLLNDLKSQVD